MQKHSYFEYNTGKDVTGDAFRIGASQVSKFFDRTSEWYHENLLGEKEFTGSTATVLGTAVHAGIEMYVTEGEVDYEAIEAFVRSQTDPEIDKYHILSQVEPMIETALVFVEKNLPEEVEKFVFHEILPGIGAGGSIDALKGRAVYYLKEGKHTCKQVSKEEYLKARAAGKETKIEYPEGATIMDWKTTSAKTAPTKFSRNYWFQQMTYAWVLKQQGVDINYLKLVYITQSELGRVSEKTGKPLKDYPSVVSVVTEEVTDEKLELVGECLKLVAESVDVWNKQPELRHLLAQDSRLRPKPKPILFV